MSHSLADPRRTALALIRLLPFVVPALLAACQSGGSGSDAGPRVNCTRDPALIAEKRACRGDDDCPCGAGCVLGECVADCAADGDCPGGWCDQFGRCREVSDPARIPAFALPTAGGARVSASLIRFADTSALRPLHLRSRDGAPGPVRVVVDPHLRLRCGEAGDFVRECRFDDVPAGTELTVFVGFADPGASVADGQVRVYYRDEAESISVTAQPEGDRAEPTEDRLVAGEFAGAAELIAVGTAEDPADPGTMLEDLSVPLTAQLFLADGAGTGTLVLDDPLQILIPTGRWVGRVAASGAAAGTVDFPTVAFLTGRAADGADIEVLVDAPAADYVVGNDSFHFELLTRFEGVLIGERRPQARWRVALSRRGELPADAREPTVPADVEPSLSTTRGLSPTAWEAALGAAATPAPDSLFSLPAEDKRTLLGVGGANGDGGSLEACNLSARVADALALFGLRDSWGADSPYGTERRPPVELTRAGLPIVSRLASALTTRTAVAVNAVLRPSTVARVLPCQGTFPGVDAVFSAACGADETVSFFLGAIDVCDEMAATYGCEVASVDGATMTISASISYEDASACVRSLSGLEFDGTVSRVCRMPVVPAPCAELAFCYEPPESGGTTRDSVIAPYLAAGDPLPVSGDLPCASGARSFAIAVDASAELAVDDPGRPDAATLLNACGDDLALLLEPAPADLRPFGEGLRTGLLADPRCLDPARFLWALGFASDSDRRRATEPDSPVLPLASTLSHRLLQRWLLQHGWIAREASETERMAQVFRGSGLPEDPVLPEVDEVLARSLRGWDLLLHPRFATAADRLPAGVVAVPDYRPVVAGAAVTSQSHHEQPTGLPVAILETLSAQLALVEPRLEEAALARDATALESFASVLRYAAVVRPIAVDLAGRAAAWATAAGEPEPAWLGRYRGLLQTQKGTLSRLITLADTIRVGGNPLGITDEDLPLYFFGDEATATRRFSAISDFLIGNGPGSLAWAPTVVRRSTDSLAAARTAWTARRERAVQVAQSDAELERRLDEIRVRYGTEIYNLCGYPEGIVIETILDDWEPFDGQTCFVRADDPLCEFDVDGYVAMLDREQLEYQMCVVREMRRVMGTMIGWNDPVLNRLADELPGCETLEYPTVCADSGYRFCASCRTSGETLVAMVTPDVFLRVGGVDAAGGRVLGDARNACLRQFPGVDPSLPGLDAVADPPTKRSECYNGSIGEAVFEILDGRYAIAKANQELADFTEKYDIAMRSCLVEQVGHDGLEAAEAAHQQTITSLREGKLAADSIAFAAAGVADCCSLVSSSWSTAFVAGLAGCISIAIRTASEITAAGLDFAIDQAEDQHEALMTQIEGDIDEVKCFNDAEMELVGIRAAAIEIEQAANDLEKATYNFGELKDAATDTYTSGRFLMEQLRAHYVAPLTQDLWLDENIDAFLRNLRLARRIVYLSVKAVEYETQQSLALADTALTAAHPAQLQQVLDELWATAATRGVGGNRPTDLKVVLSLRQHLLQLADQTYLPEAEQRLTDVDRFRLLLQSPRYAVYDAAGTYLGQQIPFEIAPLGAVRLGQAQGIPLLTGGDCAERVWSVNASILGSSGLYRGASPPTFTRIDLLKSNTFYSQWCSSPDEGDDPFQTASVRPSRNLFRDPVLGGEFGEGLGVNSESQLNTRARIEAYFNVEREAFEADDYANGETAELAARGLYGSYALFLPAEVLATGAVGEGLVLSEIDDILLRLDYVSVAR